MKLISAELGTEYTITSIDTSDDEMESFLFSLGCYSGEKITVIDKNKRNNLVVSIKDARYSIDQDLASAIEVSL